MSEILCDVIAGRLGGLHLKLPRKAKKPTSQETERIHRLPESAHLPLGPDFRPQPCSTDTSRELKMTGGAR